jgi:transcriptional regulator with GAF, ATPase, and Fis domain
VGERPDQRLAEIFATIARELQAESGPEKTHERITRAAVDLVDGCDHAAISLVKRRRAIQTIAATDDVPERVDEIQYEVREGPCLEAIDEHDIFLIADLAEETRWPRFSHRAVKETGVRSMLAFQLIVADDTMGALNLYSRKVGAFDEQARGVGAILAAHAAIAMAAAQEKQHAGDLEDALQSNRRIGMAMGVLMARGHLGEDEAFALLRRASQFLNVKLRDIAERVVETGELPRTPTS